MTEKEKAELAARVDQQAYDYAHSHYKRIDWSGAQVDFTEGAKWALAQLAPVATKSAA